MASDNVLQLLRHEQQGRVTSCMREYDGQWDSSLSQHEKQLYLNTIFKQINEAQQSSMVGTRAEN